jgi:hypothetical protein
MSWVEKINNGILITTGDGQEYRPNYILASREKDYHVSEFDFINIAGTLVKRQMPRGRRYSFEFIFESEDHLDTAELFEKSADDIRPWTVLHPFYGSLKVQPINLKHDPTAISSSKFTGEFVETISEDYPKVGIDPADTAKGMVSKAKEANIEMFTSDIEPSTAVASQMKNDTSKAYTVGASTVSAGYMANDYFQAFNDANSAINNLASDASLACTLATDLLFFPSMFETTVKFRLQTLVNQYLVLINAVDTLINKNQKKVFEINAGTVISAMVNTVLNPIEGDYTNSDSVISAIEIILDNYNSYIGYLNDLQTINGGSEDSYIPDFEGVSNLSLAVNYTVSNLLEIASGAKKQRTYILPYDSNPILLAHRFYGLNAETDNITRLIDENNLTDVLQVKANTKIVYYV